MPAVEVDPLHREFVHGTNYEMSRSPHAMPVIEHNSHAYPTYNKESRTISDAQGDAKKIPEVAKTITESKATPIPSAAK